jgi:hypothetical protein
MRAHRSWLASLLALCACTSPWGSLRERSQQCTGARRDCDGDARNGCEVDTLTDRLHCGQCGRAVSVACQQGRGLEVRALTGGAGTLCAAVSDDAVWGLRCWGANGGRQASASGASAVATPSDPTPQDDTIVHAMAMGDGFGCAVRDESRTLRCWGDGLAGGPSDGATPAPSESLVGVRAIAVGARHVCAILPQAGTENAIVRCFGDNDRGQLGAAPTAPGGGANVLRETGALLAERSLRGIAAGASHTCAFGDDGVWCWGSNDEGQLGRPARFGLAETAAMSVRFAAASVRVHDLAAAGESTCAIVSEGLPSSAGDAGVIDGAVSMGDAGDAGDARVVADASAVADAGASADAGALDGGSVQGTCGALALDRPRVVCWGAIARGAGECTHTTPVVVRTADGTPLEGVTRVFVGAKHACALRSSGEVFCWGEPDDGRLADGTARAPMVASPVPSLRGARSLSIVGAGNVVPARSRDASREGFCALFDAEQTAARVRCWGPNGAGQLGDSARGAEVNAVPSEVRW